MTFADLFSLIPPYTKIFALFLAYLAVFSYLCTINILITNTTIMQQTPNKNISRQSDHLSTVNCPLDPKGRKNSQFSARPEGALATERDARILNSQSLGRTQLAQMYFPNIQPKSAWEKLRSLLLEEPGLVHLTKLKRRTFLPAEVNIIYQHLGRP